MVCRVRLEQVWEGKGVGSGTVPTPTKLLLGRIKKIILHIGELYPRYMTKQQIREALEALIAHERETMGDYDHLYFGVKDLLEAL